MSTVETELEVPHLTFTGGLPGFPEAHTFVLLNTDLAQEPFAILRCIEDEALEFVVAPPVLFFPDYAPEIDDATVERIGLTDVSDALLLVILTVGDEAADITANLMGPIVINSKNHYGAQAVLTTQGYELRQPLFSQEAIDAVRAEGESAS